MKKIFLICFTISWVAIVITGCTKGGGNSVTPTPPPPPTPAAPILTVTAIPDTAWYAKTAVINWSSTNATSVSLAGGSISGTSGSFTTSALTTPITYSFTATGPGGSITKQAGVYVWSQILTFLCWDDVLNQYGKWANTITMVSTDGGVTWSPGVLASGKLIYYPDGRLLNDFGGLSHYQISFVGSDTYINLGETFNPPNKYKLESLSATTMVLSKYSSNGLALFMITWTKVP
jgi:hypothetical protein